MQSFGLSLNDISPSPHHFILKIINEECTVINCDIQGNLFWKIEYFNILYEDILSERLNVFMHSVTRNT